MKYNIFNRITAHTIQLYRCKVLVLTGDLAVEADCQRIVDATTNKFQTIHVLVPNAGILTTGSLDQMPLEEYDRQMNVNVRSVVHLMKLCSPYLIETKGNVVNVSSVAGLRAVSVKFTFSKVKMS